MKEHKLDLPLQLKVDEYGNNAGYKVLDSKGYVVSEDAHYECYPFDKESIEYIVQSANLFPEAIRLLQILLEENMCSVAGDKMIRDFLTKLEKDEKDSK